MDNKPFLTFSRAKLAAFLACQRRFELRYREELAWPTPPLEGGSAEAMALGQRFHQLIQRHFLGLSVREEIAEELVLRRWWGRFVEEGPSLPAGKRFVELKLTVPIGEHLLTGRFDMLIISERDEEPEAFIYDWKTSKARSHSELRNDLQTRLYLALVAEGGSALGLPIKAEKIQLTYWFVQQPQATVTLAYDQEQHQANWADITELVSQIEEAIQREEPLPKTDDLSECARCLYQIYCGRQQAVSELAEWERAERDLKLEPQRP